MKSDFMAHAKCVTMDPDLFFTTHEQQYSETRAQELCDGCPVIAQCLDYAITQQCIDGIFGATTPIQRYAMGMHGRQGNTKYTWELPPHGTETRRTWERRHGISACAQCGVADKVS